MARKFRAVALFGAGAVVTGGAVVIGFFGPAVAYGSTDQTGRPPVTCTEYQTGRWGTVNANGVNVRTGWGTSYTAIGQKQRGDHICITAGHPDERDPNLHWWAFDRPGAGGWIREDFVTPGRTSKSASVSAD